MASATDTATGWIDVQPSSSEWLLVDDRCDPRMVTHFETLFTLANGYAGVRGSLEMSPRLGAPGFYVAGVFDQVGGFTHEIVNLPCWLGIDVNLDGFGIDLRKGEVITCRRALDLRQGLLCTDLVWENEIRQRFRWESVRLLHQVEKHVHLLCGRLTALTHGGTLQVSTQIDAWAVKHGSASGMTRYGDIAVADLDGAGIGLAVTTRASGIRVAEASHLALAGGAGRTVAMDDDRISETQSVTLAAGEAVAFTQWTTVFTSRETDAPEAAAQAELARVCAIGADALIASHTAAWRARWQDADVQIDGDPHAQHALRVNLFHLMSISHPADPTVSLGAKGLHGNGYAGLVFWDTEIYLLPFFAYTDPAAARALLEYRYRFLADAVANADALGYRGARFPWNSSLTGREHCWRGWQEHVGSDIAYAVHLYVQATGDTAFLRERGAELIIATAAYWASRVTSDPEKGYVICGLMGPDEIHGGIDNNTFTNYLVKWHLARAAQAARALPADAWATMAARYDLTEADITTWQRISDGIFINFAADAGFHEQFDGYFRLPDRAIDRSMTKMQYTGPVQHSFKPTKVAQQADTMLMYHLFPTDFAADVVGKAYAFYESRCSHTSTLSRCIFAATAARAGLLEEAYRQTLLSLDTDLGPTAECGSGIHAACLGGNWQAVVFGFGGFAVVDGCPTFAPHLPAPWTRLAFTLRWQGEPLHVTITPATLVLRTDAGTVEVGVGAARHRVTPAGVEIALG